MLRIAVFGSGRGSNFRAILESMDRGEIPGATVCLAVSNTASAGILDIARTRGIPAVCLSRKTHRDDEGFAAAMLDLLHAHGVTHVVLAGYLKRVPPSVVAAFRNRIINIHPALLPRFGGPGMYGIHVHEAVLAAGETVSGVTVHLVDEEYDRGPILLQRRVPVLTGDTPETLAERVLAVEHQLYPEALRKIAEEDRSH